MTKLALLTDLSIASVNRRHDAAIRKLSENAELQKAVNDIIELYEQAIDHKS